METKCVTYICDDIEDSDYLVGLEGTFSTRKQNPLDQDDEFEVKTDREFEVEVDCIDGKFYIGWTVNAT